MIDLNLSKKIEGLSNNILTKLNGELVKLNEEIKKDSYEIDVEVITPLITGGALGKQDSIIRASEIKAILRWFIRYVFYAYDNNNKEASKEYLADIFGDFKTPSFFDIIIESKLDRSNLQTMGPYIGKNKYIRDEDFGHRPKQLKEDQIIFPGYKFKIIFVKKRDLKKVALNVNNKEKELFELFELILQVFGFGRLYRRGFGKIIVQNNSNKKMMEILREIQVKVKSIFNVDLKIGYLEEGYLDFNKVINVNDRKDINGGDYHILVHKLFTTKNWVDAIAEIAKAVRKKRGDFSKDEKGSIIAIFMGLPRSDKIKPIKLNNGKLIKINKNIKIPSSVIYTVLREDNQYVVYSILLLKSKKWFMLENIGSIRDIIRLAIDNYRYII